VPGEVSTTITTAAPADAATSSTAPSEPNHPKPSNFLANTLAATTGRPTKKQLIEKYGSLWDAEDVKDRRKLAHGGAYARIKADIELAGEKTRSLELRTTIQARRRADIDAELERCRAKIVELERLKGEMAGRAEMLRSEWQPDVEAFRAGEEKLRKYERYFSLETDELDV